MQKQKDFWHVIEEPAGPISGNVIRLAVTPRIAVDAAALQGQGILLQADDGVSRQAYLALSALKTMVLNFSDNHGVRSMMITSPTPGSGKTMTALNLGIQIARHTNRTALLLDLNFHRPALHRYFGYRSKAGLADYISGAVEFGDILFSPVDRLSIAPCGNIGCDPRELITSPILADLIDEAVARYKERLVILDMPSVLECDDVLSLSSSVRANLLVLGAGRTRQHEVQETLKYLSGTQTLGLVLNSADARA
jgi:Mrp family chromosome partitioning ATPase